MPRGIPKNGMNRGWFKAGDPALKVRSESHRMAIAEGQRRAWMTIRKRVPVGKTWLDPTGYLREKVSEGVWRPQHILVMEMKIGRRLTKGEVVHHIDGNRRNNAIENLYLCGSQSHHSKVEGSLVRLFRQLLKEGVVHFNKMSGEYER